MDDSFDPSACNNWRSPRGATPGCTNTPVERARGLAADGRVRDAEAIFEQLAAALPADGGSAALRSHAMLLQETAGVHEVTGRYDAAIAKHQRALTIAIVTDGPVSAEIASIYHDLGGMYHALGDHYTAEEYARRGIEIRVRIVGADHADTIADIGAHAAILHALGRLDEAETALRHCLDSELCSTHDRAVNLHNLGAIAHRRGDLAAAIGCFEAALDTKEQFFGAEHPEVAATVHNLAVCHRDLGRFDVACTLFARVIAVVGDHTRLDHTLVRSAHQNLTRLQQRSLRAQPPVGGAAEVGSSSGRPRYPAPPTGCVDDVVFGDGVAMPARHAAVGVA